MPKKDSGFDFFEDRKLAEEISKRENEWTTPHVIGIDRVNEDHHKFYPGLKFTPVDRW